MVTFRLYVPIRNISSTFFWYVLSLYTLGNHALDGCENVIFIGIHFISNVNHFKWHILAVSLEKCCSLAEKEANTLGHTAHYQIFRLSFTVFTLTELPGTTHVPSKRHVTKQGKPWLRNKISRRNENQESQSCPWRKWCWATYLFLGQREAFSSIGDSELRTSSDA